LSTTDTESSEKVTHRSHEVYQILDRIKFFYILNEKGGFLMPCGRKRKLRKIKKHKLKKRRKRDRHKKKIR
jgi:hypothetical protein